VNFFSRTIPARFGLIWFSGFRGKDLNVIFYQNMLNLHNQYKSAERKIQKTGLSIEYKDNESNIGKWLKSFFGLAFLVPSDVEDCFGDDIMRALPEDPRCTSFAEYILENTSDGKHCGQ
jgi:hypothetical protein